MNKYGDKNNNVALERAVVNLVSNTNRTHPNNTAVSLGH